ncbi:MAG: Lrp/AsnC family transcriptional regulator, partial [Candidatus Methanomethylophilaceae archaeon]|nr:Lrp/AsnC family transcriptional regulator [Candidatus Methanomethylophilaceae archaeon]
DLNISKATVSRRVAKMEEDGYISGYSIDVDVNKLGLMKSMVAIQIIGSPVSIIIEQLRAYPEISTIYKSFGDHNIVCEVFTRNVDELYEMIQTKLLKMPSVRNVEVDILVEKMPLNVNADLDLYLDKFPAQGEK